MPRNQSEKLPASMRFIHDDLRPVLIADAEYAIKNNMTPATVRKGRFDWSPLGTAMLKGEVMKLWEEEFQGQRKKQLGPIVADYMEYLYATKPK